MYTIALLPNKATQKRIVSFTKEYKNEFCGQMLDMKINQPHVTLLKTAFKPETDLKELLNILVSEYKKTSPSGFLQGLQVNPRRALISHLSNDDNIVAMHNLLLPHVKPLVDKANIKNKKFVGDTVEEVESYFKYGYRYTGDKFYSHLSLGRLNDEEIPYDLEKAFEDNFLGELISFDRIAICRGIKNTLGHVVASKKLHPKGMLFIS